MRVKYLESGNVWSETIWQLKPFITSTGGRVACMIRRASHLARGFEWHVSLDSPRNPWHKSLHKFFEELRGM